MGLTIKQVLKVAKFKLSRNSTLKDILGFYKDWKLWTSSRFKEKKYFLSSI